MQCAASLAHALPAEAKEASLQALLSTVPTGGFPVPAATEQAFTIHSGDASEGPAGMDMNEDLTKSMPMPDAAAPVCFAMRHTGSQIRTSAETLPPLFLRWTLGPPEKDQVVLRRRSRGMSEPGTIRTPPQPHRSPRVARRTT